MIQDIGYGAYVFFSIFCVLSFFWSWFLAPGTKQRSLEEMDAVFNDHAGEEDEQSKALIRQSLESSEYKEGRGEADGSSDMKAEWTHSALNSV